MERFRLQAWGFERPLILRLRFSGGVAHMTRQIDYLTMALENAVFEMEKAQDNADGRVRKVQVAAKTDRDMRIGFGVGGDEEGGDGDV